MYTSIDCMPCLMGMALRSARLARPHDEDFHHLVVSRWCRILADLDLRLPPPAIAAHLNRLVAELSGCADLYEDDKLEANASVSRTLPRLRSLLDEQRPQGETCVLSLALDMSIVGNFIDRGVELTFDWKEALNDLSASLSPVTVKRFMDRTGPGKEVLILGDNAGEIVLDTLLVEELSRLGCSVTYAVRSCPVLNDATVVDAEQVGMTALCPVVESGVDTPGTVLERCTPDFLDKMRNADLVLAKGQGNFEALQGRFPGVFCAFKVKCDRVARDTGQEIGSSAFLVTCGRES